MIIDDRDNKKSFESESTVFSSIDESMKDNYFEVYAPFEYDDMQDKNKKSEIFRNEINMILKEMEV